MSWCVTDSLLSTHNVQQPSHVQMGGDPWVHRTCPESSAFRDPTPSYLRARATSDGVALVTRWANGNSTHVIPKAVHGFASLFRSSDRPNTAPSTAPGDLWVMADKVIFDLYSFSCLFLWKSWQWRRPRTSSPVSPSLGSALSWMNHLQGIYELFEARFVVCRFAPKHRGLLKASLSGAKCWQNCAPGREEARNPLQDEWSSNAENIEHHKTIYIYSVAWKSDSALLSATIRNIHNVPRWNLWAWLQIRWTNPWYKVEQSRFTNIATMPQDFWNRTETGFYPRNPSRCPSLVVTPEASHGVTGHFW